MYAQLIAQRLHERFRGRQVPVDNRGGGNTLIGSEHVARSAPDGYTLMVITTTHVIVTQMVKAPYDPLKDFTPIATLGRSENILSVHTSLPVTNLKQSPSRSRKRGAGSSTSAPRAAAT